MPSSDDAQLLHAWTASRDEAAFRALVQRYAGLVHGAALRRAGNAELAAEAAQDAFVRLARHAGSIRRAEALPAWLHAAAVRAAADRVRMEARHRERMKRLHAQPGDTGHDDEAWRDALPLLDEAIARLGTTDRGLVLARYCQGESVTAAAQRFGLSPAAAQKRGERALEKLAIWLRRRGVVLSATVLASGLTPQLSHAAPAGVASRCSAAALAAGPAAAPAAWIAFMNAKAVSITAAVAAFCVPVGMQLHATSPPAAKAVSVSESATENSPGAALPQDTRRPEKIAVDLAALEERIRRFPPRTGRLAEELALRRMVQALDAGQCTVAAQWLADAAGREALHRISDDLYRRWASLDREGALTAALDLEDKHPGASEQFSVLAWWAETDPAGVLTRFSPDLKAAGRAKETARRACLEALSSLARTDPQGAIAAAQTNAPEADRTWFMTQALTGWAQGASPDEPLAWLARVEDATDRSNWYRGLIGVLQNTEPDKAWASLVSWPDRIVAAEEATSTLNMWAGHDPDAAIAAWLAGPAEWRNRHTAFNLASVLSYANPDAAARLARELPDAAMREHFSAAVEQRRRTGMPAKP